MQYYILHENGYKFTENVQDLTRIQMTYLTKATEIQTQLSTFGGSDSDFKNYKNNSNINKGNNAKQTLKEKVKQRREGADNA